MNDASPERFIQDTYSRARRDRTSSRSVAGCDWPDAQGRAKVSAAARLAAVSQGATLSQASVLRGVACGANGRRGGAGVTSPPRQGWKSRKHIRNIGNTARVFPEMSSAPEFSLSGAGRHLGIALAFHAGNGAQGAGGSARMKGESMATPRFIRWLRDITMADVGVVGGKNASLGERKLP